MTEKVNLGERFFWHFWHFWHFWQELRKDLILLKGFSPSSPSTWKFYRFQICSSFVRNTHTHTDKMQLTPSCSRVIYSVASSPIHLPMFFTSHCPQLKSLFNPVKSWSIFFPLFLCSQFKIPFSRLKTFLASKLFSHCCIHMLCPCIYSSCKLNLCEAHNVRQSHFSCQKIMVFTKITKI